MLLAPRRQGTSLTPIDPASDCNRMCAAINGSLYIYTFKKSTNDQGCPEVVALQPNLDMCTWVRFIQSQTFLRQFFLTKTLLKITSPGLTAERLPCYVNGPFGE